ncbi:MAG: Clp1/GlmU family protein [Candidatus Njordarchaeia archaeon]
MRIEIDPSKSLFIAGYASISIIKGTAEVFGAVFNEGEAVVVEENKSAPFKPLGGELVIEVELRGGYISYIDGDLIPEDWRGVADELAHFDGKLKVMIVGSVDVGKTGFVTFLANKLFVSGKKVAVVDADTGQSSVGPPTTIGLGFMDKKIVHLTEIPLFDAVFVGSTTPAGVQNRSIVGTSILVDRALENGADVVLVDTTGWVFDRGGRELKTGKIYLVEPDYLLLIEKEFGELFHIAKPFLFAGVRIKNLSPPPMLRERSRETRRTIRFGIFSKYFEDGEEIQVKLSSVNVRYAYLGSGRMASQDEMNIVSNTLGFAPEYVEICGDVIVVYSNKLTSEEQLAPLNGLFNKRELVAINPSKIENLLLCIRDRDDKFLGLGILKRFDPNEKSLVVYTNVDEESIKTVEFGHIKVSEKGEELGHLAPWSF